MTLTDLPWTITYKGRTYRLTPTHDCVLKMYKAIEGIDESAQVEIALHYLIKGRHPVDRDLLEAIRDLIFPNSGGSGKKLFDFDQDAEYIYAAFMQTYGIDLTKDRLHWWAFCALLGSLPSNTRFSEIVGIRGMDIPKPTKYNAEERQRIIRLKHDYALKQTEEERNENLQAGLRKIAEALIARAEND